MPSPVRDRTKGSTWFEILFGVAVLLIAAGFVSDFPLAIGVNLFWLVFAAWAFFSIRDRIRGRRKTSA